MIKILSLAFTLILFFISPASSSKKTIYFEEGEKLFKNNKIVDWLLFGLFAGFGCLSKYLFLYLGLAADIFLIYMITGSPVPLSGVIKSNFPNNR